MRDAIAGIEDITTQGSLRAFWWTVGAMFEGLVERGLDAGFGVKQLAARVDLQIRRVAEGSAKVADRLRREVLYFVAICAPVGPQVQAVQRAFKLSGPHPFAPKCSRPTSCACSRSCARRASSSRARRTRGSRPRPGRAENLPQAQADAGVGARQGGRDPQRRADEAHRGAGRAPREDAVVRRPRAGGDGVRDRAAARRERVRELLEPVAGLPAPGRRDARAARRRAPGPRGARRPARRCWTR